MIRKLVIAVVLAVALSAAAGNAYAITPEIMAFGTDVAPGLFCEVEKLDVCGDGADGRRLHEARRREG